jgi:hypothetical protein
MRYYYYAENDQKFGPFSLEELKAKRISKSTLVWTEGMSTWQHAEEIEELTGAFIPEPPPLPKTNIGESVISTKYDPTYQKEYEYTIVGLFIFIVLCALQYYNQNNLDGQIDRKYLIVGLLILRVFVIISVMNVATRQNRDRVKWGVFAFILPVLALISIGLQGKLKNNPE